MTNLLFPASDPLILAFQFLILSFGGTSLESLLTFFDHMDRRGGFSKSFPNNDAQNFGPPESFDFIIVGGGSAGSVIANRLSAGGQYTVLLLEAGGNPFPLTSIPSMVIQLIGRPTIDWSYQTVPQKNSFKAIVNQSATFHAGKALGGGSLMNMMAYMRGSPMDFDNWAHVTGDQSWAYENVLPFFKMSEDYNGYFPNSKFHSQGGPLNVEAPSYVPILEEWLQAGQEMGFNISDPNSHHNGDLFFPIDTTTKDETRFSTHRAFLYPALRRPNLKIYTYAHVHKIQLDAENRAVGVFFSRQGHQEQYVAVQREIVISAGALSSPKILMLSGIGPRDHMESLGIMTKVDLPVGKNFQDHFVTTVGPFLVNRGHSIMPHRDHSASNLQKYLWDGTGPFGASGGGPGALFSTLTAEPQRPNVYMTSLGVGLPDTKDGVDGLQSLYGTRGGILQKYLANDLGNDSFFIVVALADPKSRGEIYLQSRDPIDPPLIDPNYLSQPDDVKVMVEGVKFAVKMVAETKAFAKIGAKLTSSLFPDCENQIGDHYWECYIRQFSWTMFHYSGSCRMGAGAGDPVAVVDSQLRVIGTRGLRVIDASIMPRVTVTNTNAPTIMIAEKGAHMIINFWETRQKLF